jgi:hypothetical protein
VWTHHPLELIRFLGHLILEFVSGEGGSVWGLFGNERVRVMA